MVTLNGELQLNAYGSEIASKGFSTAGGELSTILYEQTSIPSICVHYHLYDVLYPRLHSCVWFECESGGTVKFRPTS